MPETKTTETWTRQTESTDMFGEKTTKTTTEQKVDGKKTETKTDGK